MPSILRLACLLLMSMSAAVQAQQWQTTSERDGIRVESRRVPGERFHELRLSTSLRVAPEAVADYLFGKFLDVPHKHVRRTFIRRDRALTVWSDVLSTRMISDRCYSMRFERQHFPGGEIRVKFVSLDFVGRKPTPHCVALRSRGEWIMTPTRAGTRLTYVSLTDVGGNVPALMARRSLASAALLSIRKVVAGASGLPLPRGIDD